MKWDNHMYGAMGTFEASVLPIVIQPAPGGVRYQIAFGRTVYLSGATLEEAKADAERIVKRELRKAVRELTPPRIPLVKARRARRA